MTLLTILWIAWILSEILLGRFMRAKKSENNLDKSTLKIIWIVITISLTIAMFIKNNPYTITREHPLFLYYCGLSLIVGGLIIRWISILKLKKYFTVNVSVSEDHSLVRNGIYKYIRHPSYLGSLLSFFGLGIIFNSWPALCVIFIPIFLAFAYRMSVEEKVLLDAFGDLYAEYKKKSWKLIPKIF